MRDSSKYIRKQRVDCLRREFQDTPQNESKRKKIKTAQTSITRVIIGLIHMIIWTYVHISNVFTTPKFFYPSFIISCFSLVSSQYPHLPFPLSSLIFSFALSFLSSLLFLSSCSPVFRCLPFFFSFLLGRTRTLADLVYLGIPTQSKKLVRDGARGSRVRRSRRHGELCKRANCVLVSAQAPGFFLQPLRKEHLYAGDWYLGLRWCWKSTPWPYA